MAWNQPDDNEGRRAPRSESALRRRWAGLQRSMRRWLSSPGARRSHRSLLVGAGVLALLAWAASGLVQVPPGSKALVLRLGRPVGVLDAGLALRAPWPVDRILVVDTGSVRSLSLRTRVLTADRIPADLTATLRYQVQDVPGFLQSLNDTDATLNGCTERLARRVAATMPLETLLEAPDTSPAFAGAVDELRSEFNALGVGISVMDVMLTEVQVPAALAADVAALQAAKANAHAQRDAANAYVKALLEPLPAARERLLQEADAYHADTIATAESEAARFEAVLPEYRKAPDITRRRMYIEAVEAVLTRARKVVVDAKVGSSYNLPLEKVLQQAVRNQNAAPAASAATGAAPAPDSAEDTSRSRDRSGR